MRAKCQILGLILFGCLVSGQSRSDTIKSITEWQTASVSSSGDLVTFCIEGERPRVAVSLYNYATEAKIDQKTARELTFPLGSSTILNSGCHTFSLTASGPPSPGGAAPYAVLVYWEHIVDMGAESLPAPPGAERQDYTKAGRETVDDGIQSLAVKGRFYIDCFGTDDACIVFINGTEVRRATYGTTYIFDITQRLLPGIHYTVQIVNKDNNRGYCWDAGHRVADSSGWIKTAGAHYANTPCSGKLPKGWKDVYIKRYEVVRSE